MSFSWREKNEKRLIWFLLSQAALCFNDHDSFFLSFFLIVLFPSFFPSFLFGQSLCGVILLDYSGFWAGTCWASNLESLASTWTCCVTLVLLFLRTMRHDYQTMPPFFSYTWISERKQVSLICCGRHLFISLGWFRPSRNGKHYALWIFTSECSSFSFDKAFVIMARVVFSRT